ncbi:hypothetical protein CLG85_022035 [Yangia mangrovi]|uniref:Sulfotransferase family protein n=1 Tax=Alloyangia mangrovi TaxID=1779329 RepID=A0A2A3JVZ7_9RHOB|nr:hypothetical protein [Alloyangia mangrovi]MCT4372839.1 hypothetical protein [Alloyangia mangrovi]
MSKNMNQSRVETFEAEPKRPAVPRTAVVVLGMHRSGTSALAGVLSLLGCDQPATLMVPNRNNEKGYFESNRIYQLHTQLFASAATSWDDWLPVSQSWLDSPRAAEFHERALAEMSNEFGSSSLFVLKDPRVCRLVPFWEKVFTEFGATPAYILTHRNPLEVASSLNKRDGMVIGMGLLIWLRHVLEAESGTRGRVRCFTSFGQLMQNWVGVAEKIQKTLDLSLPKFSLGAASEVDAFLVGGLQHHREAEQKVLQNPMLSIWVRDTYAILERWADEGEDSSDFERLDAIRAELDSTAPAFAQVLKTGRDEVSAMSARIGELTEELASRDGKLEAQAAALEETHAQEQSALAQRSLEAEETRRALDELLVAKERSEVELQSLRDREILLEAQVAQKSEQLRALEDTVKTQYRELADMTRILAEKEASLDREREMSAQALEHERKIASQTLERERAARVSVDARNTQLDTRLQTQFRELADVTRFLAESEQGLTGANQRRVDVQEQLNAEKARAGQVEEMLRREIAALRTSTSWRMTQPLRAVVNWVRGSRG